MSKLNQTYKDMSSQELTKSLAQVELELAKFGARPADARKSSQIYKLRHQRAVLKSRIARDQKVVLS